MVKKAIVVALTLLLVSVIAGCGAGGQKKDNQSKSGSGQKSSQKKDDDSDHATSLAKAGWTVEPFRFTDDKDKPFGMSDLKGKVWLTNMVFTNCDTVCPPMTANLSNVQSALQKQDQNIPIVSFSVDPKRDNPKSLKKFGKKFDVDFDTWHFLTGYQPKKIKTFAKSSFHSGISKIANSDQFSHSTSFFLVNQKGQIMVKYDGLHPPVNQVVKDVKTLKSSDGAKVATKGNETSDSAEEKPLNVRINIDENQLKPSKKSTLKTIVSEGNQDIDDADEVMFEIWKKGKDKHHKTKAKSQGNGTYSVTHTFDSAGTYEVISHVTAHGQHTMPKKTIKVQK